MRGRLIISRFSLLTGLSPKTLRYYDEINLLCPAAVDDLTSYRYYSVSQIDLAVRIRRWRELGLPLEDIRALIDHPGHAKEVWGRHEQRLSAEIEQRQHSLLHLRTYLQEDPMNYRIEQLPARQTLSIRTRLQPPNYEVIPEALRELMMHARARGYQIDAPSFFVHDNDDQGEGSLVEVYLPTGGHIEGDGRIEVRTFKGVRLLLVGSWVPTTKREPHTQRWSRKRCAVNSGLRE
ncbi:MerR family transcriptional regulator [Deinococcus oregonensis]|uniref:MerR family transcriptional regulator n=1 Tax=Deinococcus oregonensis TaxID=1805970 RepID=A0ABV6B3U3_9DEIO